MAAPKRATPAPIINHLRRAEADIVRERGPEIRAEVLKNTGHALFVDRLEPFNRVLEMFLATLQRGTPRLSMAWGEESFPAGGVSIFEKPTQPAIADRFREIHFFARAGG